MDACQGLCKVARRFLITCPRSGLRPGSVTGMKGILCDISAMRYHARRGLDAGRHPYAQLARVPADCLHRASDVRRLAQTGTLARLRTPELPLHLLVPTAGQAQSNRFAVCHSCRTELPFGSVQRVAEGLFCLTPAGCFLYAARRLTLLQLIAYGCQICGSFAVDPDGAHELLDHAPVLHASDLRMFLARAPAHLYGIKKARAAAAYVSDGYRSPREVLLGMQLCLPRRLGGRALALEPNRRVSLSPRARRLYGRGYCVCDLFHEETRLDLEIDGAYHRSAEQQARDALRQTALMDMGIAVVRVTGGQAADTTVADAVAHLIAARAGRRVDRSSCGQAQEGEEDAFAKRRKRLVTEVLALDRALYQS